MHKRPVSSHPATFRTALVALLASSLFLPGSLPAAEPVIEELIITNHFTLPPGSTQHLRLVIRANHVVIDGRGATLQGPARPGNLASFEAAGPGIRADGCTGLILSNLAVRGFATGLHLRDCTAARVEGCDFSDNYHNPKHGWGELPPRGGILLERVHHSLFGQNRANRVWDALHLVDSHDNLVEENDFSHCSNTCAKLWRACRNRFLRNNLSYGIRIDRAAGEVHARDSTCVLIETGSDDNFWYRNDITHGGDGIFIRPLNRWVSRGNVFIENDTSYANNNCVESWSPGNTFIRNRANHGSYGFWLGGSDQTVLIGNEAAYNGLTNGYHQAPEPGFSHGGIVIVGGPSSHTRIEGNYLHHNNGAGIAFRGDTRTQGARWRTEHWIVQQNRIVSNRFGLWGRWADNITLAANELLGNAEATSLEAVTHLQQLDASPETALAPIAELLGPDRVEVGQPARFDASRSRDPQGRPLTFQWHVNEPAGSQPALTRTFDRPGLHRVSLTIHNGALADLAWRDVLAVEPVARELGTEGAAADWGFQMELNDAGQGRVAFADDTPAVVGGQCLRFTPNPYTGAYVTAVYPATRDAAWNFAGAQVIQFWIKTQNPNLPGWQNAGPVVRLHGSDGTIEYRPAQDANLLNDPPFSEARWLWMPISIPLAGDAHWQQTQTGPVTLDRIQAISISLDSWGGDPFTVWLDGLTVRR